MITEYDIEYSLRFARGTARQLWKIHGNLPVRMVIRNSRMRIGCSRRARREHPELPTRAILLHFAANEIASRSALSHIFLLGIFIDGQVADKIIRVPLLFCDPMSVPDEIREHVLQLQFDSDVASYKLLKESNEIMEILEGDSRSRRRIKRATRPTEKSRLNIRQIGGIIRDDVYQSH